MHINCAEQSRLAQTRLSLWLVQNWRGRHFCGVGSLVKSGHVSLLKRCFFIQRTVSRIP